MERPLRLKVDLSRSRRSRFRAACGDIKEQPLANGVDRVFEKLGTGPHLDFNRFMDEVEADAREHGIKLTAKRKGLLRTELAERDETAQPVLKKVHKSGKAEADPKKTPVGQASGALCRHSPLDRGCEGGGCLDG